jgi:hypothetical protein
MANTIKPKRSYTTSAVPTLAAGELGINASTDGKIWIGNAAGTGIVLVASRQASDLVGTVAVASGGTGQTTANAGFNALAPSQTSSSGKYLKTDGTNTSWSTLPTALAVYTRSATTVNVGLSNGSLPVTNRGGSTINVAVS